MEEGGAYVHLPRVVFWSVHGTSVCPMEVDVYIDMQISTAGTINVLI